MYDIERLPSSINIGFTGEHKFRKIEIDMTAWMEKIPDGIPSIIYVRPGESASNAYAVSTTFENNILTWEITQEDLGGKEGSGIAQIWLEDTTPGTFTLNKRGMSTIITTNIHHSACTDTPGEPTEQLNWDEQIAGKLGISDIENNLSTTQPGKALDARQGKVLDGKKLDKPSGVPGGKFLQTNGNGNAVWGSPASEATIVQETDEWLGDHITNPSSPPLDSSLSLSNAAAPAKKVGDIKDAMSDLAENGYYTEEEDPSNIYIELTSGGINSSGVVAADSTKGYVWLTSEQEAKSLKLDTSVYSYNLCYMNGETVAKYTPWLTTSPIVFDSTEHTKIGVNVKKTAGGNVTSVLSSILYYTSGGTETIGNLATKDYAVARQQNVSDAGKILGIGAGGVVAPIEYNEVVVDETLSVEGDAADAKATGDIIDELATNGCYDVQGAETAQSLTKGMVTITNTVNTSQNDNGYIYIPKNSVPTRLLFNTSLYKVNTGYVKNNAMISGTYSSWITTSPVTLYPPDDYDTLVVNVRKLSGNMSSSDLSGSLKSVTVSSIGNLATKSYVDAHMPSSAYGRKMIYPDGFTSRIKPNIYFNGKYIADINIDSYKISGGGDVWVATNGNDTTGDGTEGNPYATITKALTTSAKNIYVKEGTYTQGTHYASDVNLAGRNIIGVGTVTFQNDSSGHCVSANASAYFENIIFKHGETGANSVFSATCSTSGQVVCFKNCTFRDGAANGLAVQGIDAVVSDCVAYGNKLDGFNYHDRTVSSTTYVPNVIEIDCVAYNNGDSESGSDSCNGSTAHDGVQIIRLNGEYYSCYGGVIADIARTGSGDPATKSVNLGVLAHESTGTGTYKASFWASYNTEMYMYSCESYGGTYDISAVNDAKVVTYGLVTGRDNPAVNRGNSATVIQH